MGWTQTSRGTRDGSSSYTSLRFTSPLLRVLVPAPRQQQQQQQAPVCLHPESTDRQTDRSVEARYCCTFVCFVIDLTCHSKVAVSEHEGGTDQREGNKRHLKVFLPQDGRKLALFGCSTASLVLVVVVLLLAVVLAVAVATASGVSFGAAVLTVRHIGCGRSNGSVVRRNGGTFGTEMFGSEQTLEHGFCGFGRFRWRR